MFCLVTVQTLATQVGCKLGTLGHSSKDVYARTIYVINVGLQAGDREGAQVANSCNAAFVVSLHLCEIVTASRTPLPWKDAIAKARRRWQGLPTPIAQWAGPIRYARLRHLVKEIGSCFVVRARNCNATARDCKTAASDVGHNGIRRRARSAEETPITDGTSG
jgi:hypothetical protein